MATYLIIAADHRFPDYVSSVYAHREYVSRGYARLGNALRQAAALAELFATVTVVAMSAAD
jgi:hypothetical protein